MRYESVSRALEELAAEHPEVVDRGPEQSNEQTAWSTAPPTDTEELHRLLTDELDSTAGALVACEAARSNWEDERRWEQLAGAVSTLVREQPEVGLNVLDAVGAGHADIDHAVVRGWTMCKPESELAPRILDRIGALDLSPIVGTVTAMLGGVGYMGNTPMHWFELPGSEDLAKKCWDAVDPKTESNLSGADDHAMTAINHPAGHLAEFWVERIGHLWRSLPEGWRGIPPEIADYLAELISEENSRSEAVEITFCRYLYFFHQADAEWCKQYLIPLLDWDHESRASKTWSGFLSHGGWTNDLLNDGFLEMLVSTTGRSEQLDRHGKRNLPGLLAKIAVAADVDPRSWIRDLVTTSSVAERVAWARALRHQLASLDPDAVEAQWDRWMRDYLSDRVGSVPRRLEREEASAIAGWVLFLADSMPDAIDLVLQMDTAGFGMHDLFLHDLENASISHAPEKVALLLHHMLKSTEGQFVRGLAIKEVYEDFKLAGVPDDTLRQIAEQAIRLGFDVD